MRGENKVTEFTLTGCLRNIPACAGKTVMILVEACTPREHPRVRGENIKTLLSRRNVTGTSPRARGKPPLGFFLGRGGGNIPACAGKTEALRKAGEANAEHPRVRGENPQKPLEGL